MVEKVVQSVPDFIIKIKLIKTLSFYLLCKTGSQKTFHASFYFTWCVKGEGGL